ncbi:MAG: potassium transporter Kup [Chakrabartia sp.]
MQSPESASHSSSTPHSASRAVLAIGAIGVVFGDIGTSPLYAFREALNQAAETGIGSPEIMGVLSLALWSLIIVVTIKYVLFLMRADNEGEGGVLALLALAGRAIGGRRGIVLVLGAAGAALFYGDAIITPALSVLSAVEGLKTLPVIGDGITEQTILQITVVLLVALFAIQSRGTAMVSKLFGPICVLWFVAIGGLGLLHISDEPAILGALSPHYAVVFLMTHGVVGLFVLGAVFLTVTGAEALTADMGHFGRVPIQAAWFMLVFPALMLNYFGQGAFALAALEKAQATGVAFENQDWFFLMAPESVRIPLVILAGLATIIASQAVITGAFSLTQQAIQLGLFPRMRIMQTSAGQAGQIYLPVINWLLLVGVLILVNEFRTSSSMAAAYGIAVTGTMVVTTCLAFVVVHKLWHWSLAKSVAFTAPFLALDVIFFGANILRVAQGGWVPLVIGASIGLIIWIWVRGKKLIAEQEQANAIPLAGLATTLAAHPPTLVKGTAVYLTSNPGAVPSALLHNLKHNKVLHEQNLITTIRTASIPHVGQEDRVTVERVSDAFSRVTLRYGFMEMPNVPHDMGLDVKSKASLANPMTASFFIGRNSLRASADEGLPLWQDQILIFLQRNASNPTDFFHIPANRVVELGVQMVI